MATEITDDAGRSSDDGGRDGETDRDARIRERAYRIWEAEGKPDGRQEDHWAQASQELENGDRAQFGDDDPTGEQTQSLPLNGNVSGGLGGLGVAQPRETDRVESGVEGRAPREGRSGGRAARGRR